MLLMLHHVRPAMLSQHGELCQTVLAGCHHAMDGWDCLARQCLVQACVIFADHGRHMVLNPKVALCY
jgi:hypothetical protein